MIKRPFTTGEVADYCHVTYRTVLKWIASGKLRAYRTPGKHSRVRPEDFLEFLNKYQMPIPDNLRKYHDNKKRILIVDDDKGMVNAIKRILRLENGRYKLDAAFDGFDVGRKLLEFKPDLIILDIRMPGMDGYEVIKKIRQTQKNSCIKIIAISAYFEERGRHKVISAGADDFIEKPFETNEFLRRIQEILS